MRSRSTSLEADWRRGLAFGPGKPLELWRRKLVRPRSVAATQQASSEIDVAFLWVDLCGHLSSIWRYVTAAAELVYGQLVSASAWKVPEVDAAIEAWLSTDLLYAAFQDLGAPRQADS